MASLPNSEAPRILITRLSAIGDCILTMPLVCALRRALPQAFIAWAVEKAAAPLVEQHACVDQVIRVPKRVLRQPGELWRLRRALQSWRFDVALDPQSLTKSALLGWLSGARQRIGFRAPIGRELAPWLATDLVDAAGAHVVDRYLSLLRPLGCDVPAASEVRFEVPQCASADQKLEPFLHQPQLAGGYAVINPGAGWPTKLWPAERFGQIARQLGQRTGTPSVVVWAGKDEQRWAEEIVAAAPQHAVLAPATSLLELAAIVRHGRLFVGSDTGPLHLAAACGVKCVGIYGPTRPDDCGPYGRGHRVVQAYHQVASGRLRKQGPNDAMRAVTVEAVWQACQAVLDEAEGEASRGVPFAA